MSAHRIRLPGVAVSLVLTVGLAACGSSASSSQSPTSTSHSATPSAIPSTTAASAAHAASVAISSYAFHPSTTTVVTGAKITFTNHDQTAHTATSTQSGVFDTGTLNPGASRTVTLTKPGTYTYYCQFHAFMKATITVR